MKKIKYILKSALHLAEAVFYFVLVVFILVFAAMGLALIQIFQFGPDDELEAPSQFE